MKINIELLEKIIRGTPEPRGGSSSAPTSDTESGPSSVPSGSVMPAASLSSSSSTPPPMSILDDPAGSTASSLSSASGTGAPGAASAATPAKEPPEVAIKRRLKVWEDLYTAWGQENMKQWFLARANKNKSSNLCFLAENAFVNFLRQLTDLSDWEILEVFDILDRTSTGCVYWEEFFLLVALYTAYSCHNTTQFLYKHGSEMYKRLCDPITSKLTFERFARLGFLVGVSEDDILYTLRYFALQKADVANITVEDFVLYYFNILTKVDGGVEVTEDVPKRSSSDEIPNPAPKQAKERQKCSIS